MRRASNHGDHQISLQIRRLGLYPLLAISTLLLLCSSFMLQLAAANPRDHVPGIEADQAGTSIPAPTAQITFDDTDHSLCKREPSWLTVQGTVKLPGLSSQAILQTQWYVVHPNDQRTQPAYHLHGLVRGGMRFSVQVYWPGLRPMDRMVEIHIGAMLLDPLTLNPIMKRGASLDYYWYPWVCPAPTVPPTAIVLPTARSTPTATPVPPTLTPTSTPSTTPSPTAAPTVTPMPTETPSPLIGAHLTLSPEQAGPNVTNTTQTLVAILTNSNGLPLSGYTIEFNLTGAHTLNLTAQTDSKGLAQITYRGTQNGMDTVYASVNISDAQVTSNKANVAWVTPIQQISTTSVLGRFFYSYDYGTFTAYPGQIPAFTQSFPTINFNPPLGTIPGGYTSVDSRPMMNITTDINGRYTGSIIAQGNGLQAGAYGLYNFNSVFTGEFIVASAGSVSFHFYSDDGFIFGVGNGAQRVSGSAVYPPIGNITPFEHLPWMGDYNWDSPPTGSVVTVYFPAPGRYPYEIDYSECCAGELVLTVAIITNGVLHGVPPAGSLTLAMSNNTKLITGSPTSFTFKATDASGIPQANIPITINITGPNSQQQIVTTDSIGQAVFTYTGINPGRDTIQAIAQINGITAYSNQNSILWVDIHRQR